MRKPLSQRQFLDAEVIVIALSGTGSTTPTVDLGGYAFTAVRSDNGGGTRNRLTLTSKKPIFGKAPIAFSNCNTAGADWKVVSSAISGGVTTVVLDAFQTSDGTTKVTDAVGTIMLYGATVTKEGNY